MLFIKQYLWMILSGALAFFAFLARLFFVRLKRAEQKAEEYKVRSEHIKDVMRDDQKTEMDHESRSAKIAKEVEKGGTSEELSDPNEW